MKAKMQFRDTFKKVKLSPSIKEYMDRAVVEQVTLHKRGKKLIILLSLDYILPISMIEEVREAIAKSLQGLGVEIILNIRYELSSQYTPKIIYEKHKENLSQAISILGESYRCIFDRMEFQFEEENDKTWMKSTLEDSPLMKQRGEAIGVKLEQIFEDQFALKVSCQFVYKEKVEVKKSKPQVVRNEVEKSPNEPKQEVVEKEPLPWEVQEVKKPKEEVAPKEKKEFELKISQMGTFYGKDIPADAKTMTIAEIGDLEGEVIVRGQIINLELRSIRGDRTIASFDLTDDTDTITVKLFINNAELAAWLTYVKVGAFLRVKGFTSMDTYSHELTIGSVRVLQKIGDFREKRLDEAEEKRVELHCHSKMSDMDGVSDIKEIIHQAISWGHKAIAITDHGVVQAFPDAHHALPKGSDFKVIYGMEAYLVDDLVGPVEGKTDARLDASFVIFDLETTGLSADRNKIIEIGACKVVGQEIVDSFTTFVDPKEPIPYYIQNLTSITDRDVIGQPVIEEVLPKFLEFCKGSILVAHNASFDVGFIAHNARVQGLDFDFTYVDTVSLARVLFPELGRYKLDTLAKKLEVPLESHHRAVDDARCTAGIWIKLVNILKQRDIHSLLEIKDKTTLEKASIAKLPAYHCIILATSEVGRINLYRLVSEAHLHYYNRKPKLPKSLLNQYREGLILGTACEAGQLYQAILGGSSKEKITQIVDYYDYLEIQPIDNNRFLIEGNDKKLDNEEDLRDINRQIVALGEEFNKPVCATCDVHFLNPEDDIYRKVIMAGKKFKDADDQPPLYLRTTEEMLKEFAYLGSQKAYEVVVENPNKIADMCEIISPVHPDKFPPVIENSDKDLREMCYERAYELYGNPLPKIVVDRLEKELNSIISNGFAVMYIIAQKLVKKSNDDGYLVGSRGSVGSSFVATMSQITEVNPLPPHYYCPSCHYSDFDTPEVKAYSGRSGCDMPDKNCPSCGHLLAKEGHDIPFETFLGFKGNKEPDIDLNFSGEYQSEAHKYTEVIFGTGYTFRAGTIGTIADKTAFGFVQKYFEERGIRKRKSEIGRIAKGCTGIRRTTGQHPGGIIVLPHGEEIYKFTPVQHPANDSSSGIITTHFDYHKIDHNLLKLDILGHDDPTMIRMLEDLTGYKSTNILLDDESVLSLFTSTKELKIQEGKLPNLDLGCLCIPEFGTEFTFGMLKDTKPTSFSELVRIAGLSHGTDVWLGNARDLIVNNVATLSTCICTRDDIMTYLIGMGLDDEESFTIMESVRKGKGLRPEWEESMRANNVPEWYIESCKKIKYMFPKAHAVAYVMMAFRIAWYKIHYPLEYYVAYFTVRASGFNYQYMCQGEDKANYVMQDLVARKNELSAKEELVMRDLKLVQEMYARGYEFLPIDIYKADAKNFQIIDGKIMPALSTIDGLGEKVAETLMEEARKKTFISKKDLNERGKVSKTLIETMESLGIIQGLPETNQLNIFDLMNMS